MGMVVDTTARVIALGLGATLVMDLWALLRQRVFGVASLDYGLVGRWLGHMCQGRFRHLSIGRARPIPGERALGWSCHYLVGVVFAAAFVALVGTPWLCRPLLAPALLLGVLSVAAPFLLMQPAWGMGLAASRTASPWRARSSSLLTHLVFGLGLYWVGWAAALLAPAPCG